MMIYHRPGNLKDRQVKTEIGGTQGTVQQFFWPQKTGSFP